jgi:hypothetical protein
VRGHVVHVCPWRRGEGNDGQRHMCGHGARLPSRAARRARSFSVRGVRSATRRLPVLAPRCRRPGGFGRGRCSRAGSADRSVASRGRACPTLVQPRCLGYYRAAHIGLLGDERPRDLVAHEVAHVCSGIRGAPAGERTQREKPTGLRSLGLPAVVHTQGIEACPEVTRRRARAAKLAQLVAVKRGEPYRSGWEDRRSHADRNEPPDDRCHLRLASRRRRCSITSRR